MLFMFGLLLFIDPTPVSAHVLDNFDMKTANASGVTAESIDKVLSEKAGSVWHGQGETIMDISKATGINAAFFLAKMLGESGWDNTPRLENANNPGNIIHTSGTPFTDSNGRKWQKFGSMEEGLKGSAELLNSYYDEKGLKTLKQALSRWAPETDSNNHNQMMDIILSIAKTFGQDLSTGGSVNVGSGEYEKATKGGKEVGSTLEPLIEFGSVEFADPAIINKGVNQTSSLSGSLIVSFSNFANNIYEKSKVVTSFMTVAFILYTFISMFLVIVGYNGLFEGSKVIQTTTDFIFGTDVSFDRKGLFKLIGRACINLVILAVVISGIYVLGYVFIYNLLSII